MSIPSLSLSNPSLRARLQKFKGRYAEVSELSGLSYSFVSKFACGERGKRPGFNTMRSLEAAIVSMEHEAATSHESD